MQAVIITGWMLSLAALIGTVMFVVHMARRRNKTDAPVSAWVAYTVGMFIVIFIIILSQEIAGLAGSDGSPKVIDALFASLQMFGLNRDIELDTATLSFLGGALPAYIIYNAVLFLAAPVGTIGTILSLIGQLFVVLRMKLMARKRDTFVFSDLNNESLVLARSTQDAYAQNGEECLLVFSNVGEDNALATDAKGADMMCLAQSINSVAQSIQESPTAHTFVFSNTENEIENLSGSSDLAYDLASGVYASAQTPSILLFSSSPVGGPFVDAVASAVNVKTAESSRINVRLKRVDWVRSTVDTLLDRYPLFCTGIQESCMQGGVFESTLAFDTAMPARRILIVGDGLFATEFLKGALWASQMGCDITTTIDLVSMDAHAIQQRFEFEAPEFFNQENPYQEFFNLNFIEQDFNSGQYLDYLRSLAETASLPTYVLVAIEDDLKCATVARRTREILEQCRLRMPQKSVPAFIAAVINDDDLAQAVLRMKARSRLYGIQTVGNAESIYSYSNIFSPELDSSAANLNRIYSRYGFTGAPENGLQSEFAQADREFYNSEYNRRSSIASALHRKYSLYLFCRRERPEFVDAIEWVRPLRLTNEACATEAIKALSCAIDAYDDYLDAGQGAWLAEVEHDRWAAYVATEGHEYAAFDDVAKIWDIEGRHDYMLARLHPCLMKFETLPDLDSVIEPLKGRSPEFQQIDGDVLRNIRIIAASEETIIDEWKKRFG